MHEQLMSEQTFECVKVEVLAEDIADCCYLDNEDCAIARAINRVLADGYYARVGGSSFCVAHTTESDQMYILTYYDIPGEYGFPRQQREHPEGFTFPVQISPVYLRETVT